MKLECDVIRDLLPLYAEKLASPASSALVEQHLAECPACRAELEQMEKPVPVQPEPQPDAPLRGIRKTLQKKSIRIAAAAVLAVLCAFGLVFWMGGAKTPVTAEQAKIWTYNKKENEANLCVLEVQGENVRLELEGSFNWGNPSVTVRAVRYTFPHIHAALEGLLGHIGFRYQHRCLRYAAADGAMRRRDPLLQGRSAGGAIHPEKRGWNADLCLRIRGCGHAGTRRV